MFESDPSENVGDFPSQSLPQRAPQSPRAPSQARDVNPVADMQVYDNNGSRRVGRIVQVDSPTRVVVHWRDGSVSWESFGGSVAPTTFRGV